ncbi:MAG: flagellar filament capping protein FliD [Clostridiales bacterium]|nr:flagellar filament capping protein FliD [Clostridiales bacterium]
MAEGIAGIISGIDTERLIQAMLQAESQPIKLLQGQLSALKAKGDAWNLLRAQMQTLRDLTADWQKEETWHPYRVSVEGRQGVTAALADPLKALPGIYRVTVQSLAQGEILLSAPGAVADATLPLGYTGTFSIQGEAFTLSGNESLEDLARLISSRSDITGVRARVVTPYDPATGTSGPALLLESARPGSSQRIAFSDGTSGPSGSSLLVHLGILQSSADSYAQASAVVQAAADTLVQVNGVTYRQDTLTLKGVIPGVEVSLAGARAGDELSVSVQPDEGALRQMVSRWVDAMNSLLQSIRSATRYDPDTRTGGPLQGDVEVLLLQQALGRIPAALGELGVRQTAEGSLVFDGGRFDQAWQKDPQRVRDLLAGAGGAAPRLLDELDGWLKTGGFFDAARKVRESQDQMLQDRIRRLQDFLRQREELLRRQFNAMEDAMARMTQLSQSLQAAINLMTVQAQYGKKA